MELIRRILAALWKSWFFLVFLSIFLVFYPFILIGLSNKKTYPFVFLIQLIISRWICFFSFLFIRKKYLVRKSEIPQPCIIVANHSSYLDIVFSYLLFSKYFIFMAKSELKKAPLFGLFFKNMQISVNRKSKIDAHRAFQRAAEEIRSGNSVFIFPEGTISNEGKLKPFKSGAFKLAIDLQIPIVPVTYVGNWKLLQNGGFFKSYGRPGLSKAIIHPPISTKGLRDENLLSLQQSTRDLIEKTLEANK